MTCNQKFVPTVSDHYHDKEVTLNLGDVINLVGDMIDHITLKIGDVSNHVTHFIQCFLRLFQK